MTQSIQSNKENALKRSLFVVLSFILMICLGTIYSYSVFRLPIEDYFEVNTTFSGLPYMFALAFYSISMFISGRYIQRYNPRVILIIGSSIVSLAYIISSFSNHILFLTLTYGMMGGIGVGLMYGIPLQNATLWFKDQIGLVMGSILIGFGLSPLISAPIGLYLIVSFGLMKSFMILGLALFVILLSISLLIPLKIDEKNPHELKYDSIVHTREFRGLYVNFVLGTMIGLMIVGLTSKIGVELFNLSASNVAFLMGLFAVLNGLGRPIFGYIVDRFSISFSIYVSYGLILLSSLILLVFKINHSIIFIVSFSIFWLNLGAWLSIAPNATRILFGSSNYSRNYGLVFTGYGIGSILGIVISGMMLDIFQNYTVIFIFIAMLCLFGIGFTTYNGQKK